MSSTITSILAAFCVLGIVGRASAQPVEQAKLVADDAAASDFFGCSVSVSGNTAVVGVPSDDHPPVGNAGSAYVFERVAGMWVEQATLIASDCSWNDELGTAVSISADTVVVGAPSDDHAGGTNAGSAYVFERIAGEWVEQAKLTASDAAAEDLFGCSVSISGDWIVVGAELDEYWGWTNAGSAYVFKRVDGEWVEKQKLIASDHMYYDYFGNAVSISGNTLVVGAYGDNQGDWAEVGAAYVFQLVAGEWVEQAKLTASDYSWDDEFGWSVSISGDRVVVGAHQDDFGWTVNAGSAYVFERQGAVWTQKQKFNASDLTTGDQFGHSVSVFDDTIVVGAWHDDHSGGTDAGSAHVFQWVDGVWLKQGKLTASDAADGDLFGCAVSVSGDTTVIGAMQDDHTGGVDAGAAYVFKGGTPCPADVTGDGVVDVLDLLQVLSQWGGSGSADITGDGIVDVLDLIAVLSAWGPCA